MTDRPFIERVLVWAEDLLANCWEAYEASQRRKRRNQILAEVTKEMEGEAFQLDVQESTTTTFTITRADDAVSTQRRRLN